MGNILEEISAYARVRVAEKKKAVPPEALRREAEAAFRETPPERHFLLEKVIGGRTALPNDPSSGKDSMHFICECKKASPSKGLIAEDFPYVQIAADYEAAGASAVSVLTEPKWFLGRDEYLREIAQTVQIPCLRKDFTVDPYMIYEAKLMGASAILLICAILGQEELKEYLQTADSLGLSALVEAHDERELEAAVKAGARVIGVNNRNLKDFTVDISNSARLKKCAPEGTLFVAESGIRTAEDVECLRSIGVNACLIGEQLMRAADKKSELSKLRGPRYGG